MTSIQGLAQSAALKWVKNLADNDSKRSISLSDLEKRITKGDEKGKETPFADFLKTNFTKLDTNNNQKLGMLELATVGKNFKPTADFSTKLASNALSLITGAIA